MRIRRDERGYPFQATCATHFVSPMAIPVAAVAPVTTDALESIEAAVSSQQTLEDVVRWGLLHKPPLLIADVVVQDEYTHDVVLPYRSGLFLVYDTT